MSVEEFAQGPAQSGILTDRCSFIQCFHVSKCFCRETVSLFLHFTVNPKPPVGFLDVPRCSMTGKEQTVCRLIELNSSCLPSSGSYYLLVRFQQIESRWGYSGTSDKIRSAQVLTLLNVSSDTFKWPSISIFRFIVDRRIFVVGFGLYGSIHGPSEYSIFDKFRS